MGVRILNDNLLLTRIQDSPVQLDMDKYIELARLPGNAKGFHEALSYNEELYPAVHTLNRCILHTGRKALQRYFNWPWARFGGRGEGGGRVGGTGGSFGSFSR